MQVYEKATIMVTVIWNNAHLQRDGGYISALINKVQDIQMRFHKRRNEKKKKEE